MCPSLELRTPPLRPASPRLARLALAAPLPPLPRSSPIDLIRWFGEKPNGFLIHIHSLSICQLLFDKITVTWTRQVVLHHQKPLLQNSLGNTCVFVRLFFYL